MKLNEFVKEINSQEFLWCKYRNTYGVLYDRCMLVFLDNVDKLNTNKQNKQGKNSMVLSETKEIQAIDIKELTPAARTGRVINEKDRVLECFSTESMQMWFNQDLLRWFSPSAKYYFFEDGWHRNQLYVVEKNKIIAMVLKISDKYISSRRIQRKKGR